MVAQAVFHADGSVTLTFPFHRPLIENLKLHIPASFRSYDAERKAWTVEGSMAGIAVNLVRAVYPMVTIIPYRAADEPPAPTPIRSVDRAFRVLHLLPSAPPELIEGAYKIIAKRVHPDRGGDAAAMRALNEAVALLRDEVTA